MSSVRLITRTDGGLTQNQNICLSVCLKPSVTDISSCKGRFQIGAKSGRESFGIIEFLECSLVQRYNLLYSRLTADLGCFHEG